MITEFVEKHQSNTIIAAIVASALALVGTVTSCYLTYYYNVQSQDRQVKIEQIVKFDSSSAELVVAAGAFISSINNSNKDLDAARKQLGSVIAVQIQSSEGFTRNYGRDIDQFVKEYQAALTEFNQTAQKTSSSTEMRIWSETFGRALDAKAVLTDQLYGSVGNISRS